MARYVILCHEMPPEASRATHWDLMLECGDLLRTWALEQQPAVDHTIAAHALPDHRLMYLDYQGPLSDNRGWVTQWDRGTYRLKKNRQHQLTALLNGEQLRCCVELVQSRSDPHCWTARFLLDE